MSVSVERMVMVGDEPITVHLQQRVAVAHARDRGISLTEEADTLLRVWEERCRPK